MTVVSRLIRRGCYDGTVNERQTMRVGTLALAIAGVGLAAAQAPVAPPAASRTQVVLLGTGSPPADPLRSGPATAIVVNNTSYLVDLGPGLVRRAAAAATDKGITALAADRLQTAFVTHLHSDHTVGYPDLIFTTWVQGRRGPLKVYGPAGLEDMTRHIMLAWQADIDIRTTGLEHRSRTGLDVEAHDVKPGVVYQDANVKVTAFPNAHGEWAATFGYRFDTADRSIVISGDTNPSPALIEHCQRCDVLIHEAYSDSYRPADMANWLAYRSKYHTTTSQLTEIATKTRPGLLIVHHRGVGRGASEIPESQYVTEIRRGYNGTVVVGHDLDVY
jgi:ribonuclease BN (tRNA processing enzyme)